jgi:RimJ/RimL family protein N-acetyltransferase
VNPDNHASMKLLERLGLRFEGMRDNGQTKLYATSEAGTLC